MGIGRGNHPNSRKNLRPVEPGGEPRNPNGFSRKGREKRECKQRLEELKRKHKMEDMGSFTNEDRQMYWEFLRSMSPKQFVSIAQDEDMPMGALIDAKALKSDFTEGSTRNTDRIEARIYGNKEKMEVKGSIDNPSAGVGAYGFVFGGIDIGEDEEEDGR